MGTARVGPNEALIGVPGSRWRLSTPALLVDIDPLGRNITRMAEYARAEGCQLRPHAKGHKCREIAERQVAAGAIGIGCATLGEATVMVDAGIRGVLLTSPMIAPPSITRLMALNRRAEGLVAVTDTPENAGGLSEAAEAEGKPLALLVDLDTGLERTGATSVEEAVGLAQRIAQAPGLELKGIQAYHGQLQRVPSYQDRKAAALAQLARIRALRDALRDKHLACDIVTGGGTGTFEIDGAAGVFTELQPGSYIFMDVQYSPVEITAEEAQPFENALFVQATVINDLYRGHVTINAGMKAIGVDGPMPRFTRGVPPGSTHRWRGDEHSFVVLPPGARTRPKTGDVIECVPPHCDTTANLYNEFHAVRGDTLVEIWPLAARGRW